jgi:hypothetical protein
MPANGRWELIRCLKGEYNKAVVQSRGREAYSSVALTFSTVGMLLLLLFNIYKELGGLNNKHANAKFVVCNVILFLENSCIL